MATKKYLVWNHLHGTASLETDSIKAARTTALADKNCTIYERIPTNPRKPGVSANFILHPEQKKPRPAPKPKAKASPVKPVAHKKTPKKS